MTCATCHVVTVRTVCSTSGASVRARRCCRLLLRHLLEDVIANGARLARGYATAHAVLVVHRAPLRARRSACTACDAGRVHAIRIAGFALAEAVRSALGHMNAQAARAPAQMVTRATWGGERCSCMWTRQMRSSGQSKDAHTYHVGHCESEAHTEHGWQSSLLHVDALHQPGQNPGGGGGEDDA